MGVAVHGGGCCPNPREPLSALPAPSAGKSRPKPPPTDPPNARGPSRGEGRRALRGSEDTARGFRRGRSRPAPAGSGPAPVREGPSGRAGAHSPTVCRWRSPRPPRRSWPRRSSALTWSRLHLARTRPSPPEKAPPPLRQHGRATAGRRLATAEEPAPSPASPIKAQMRR